MVNRFCFQKKFVNCYSYTTLCEVFLLLGMLDDRKYFVYKFKKGVTSYLSQVDCIKNWLFESTCL